MRSPGLFALPLCLLACGDDEGRASDSNAASVQPTLTVPITDPTTSASEAGLKLAVINPQ